METAVLLAVPEADGLVGPWRAKADPSAALGVPAHVTLLYPFLPVDRVDAGVLAELQWFFRHVDPFGVRFDDLGEFHEGGVVYLDPADDDLDQLIRALSRRWPECPPYGGVFDAVHAHLTVVQSTDAALRAEAAAGVRAGLPLEADVRQAELWSEGPDGRWSCREAFPLGPS